MPLNDIQGQPRAVETLTSALGRQQVHHAWLFMGPEGVGKEMTAVALAQALVCTDKPFQGCGKCAACTRVTKRNHPDVTWLMPEVEMIDRGMAGRSDFSETPSRDIRIEQVRRLQERLAFRALEAPHKVALIITAHAMNHPAQNALLKTLEEPPKNTVLILVSSAPDKLLPTIRSRCAKAHFGPLPQELIASLVKAHAKKGMDDALAAQVAAMSSGSLARALSFNAASLEKRKALIESFERLHEGDASGWLALAEAWSGDKDTVENSLELLRVWLRDVAVAQVGGTGLINADLAPLAADAVKKVSPARLQRRLQLIDEARNAIIARNGQAKLQLERMFIEMFAA